jgi:cation diffusion facilitator CzcD-associated flavoprotein CzcO
VTTNTDIVVAEGHVRIGIIGAGVAGLTTAKVLLQAGHDVVVYDRVSDVGGVWSASRRYPGLTTQSPKAQYSFSDFPMGKDLPQWPSGAQVQGYLAAYADRFGVTGRLRLGTDVLRATPLGEGRWELETRPAAGGTSALDQVDGLVAANGVFCEPAMPVLPGQEEFTAAGGRVLAGTELHDPEQARGQHVVVIGYGKSACDVTVPLSAVAASTDVVARQLLWKMPRKINNLVNFKMLLLTRMGEALFRYIRLHGVERFLHGPGNGLRRSMLNSIGSVSVRQFGLAKKGLVPAGHMEDIVKGAIGLATEGFFEGVADGAIVVHRDQTVARLLADSGRPAALLRDGTLLPADLIVCSTGFTQGVPFLDADVQARLFDERGNFMLYRQIQPLGVPGLWFNGYNSSFFSPLNAEMAAVWIAADLAGSLHLPDTPQRRRAVIDQLAFMDRAAGGHHCRGTKIIPFSMHNLDEVLGDLGVNIPAAVRASHWINPIAPAAYATITPRVLAGLPTPGPRSSSVRGAAAVS